MNKWKREVLEAFKLQGLRIADYRRGARHYVYKMTNGMVITVSSSPRSIDQAVRNLRRELSRRMRDETRRNG